MIDGIKISFIIKDYSHWREMMKIKGIAINTGVDTSTGEIRTKRTCGEKGTVFHTKIVHYGVWRGYKLNVKEINRGNPKNDFYLIVEGSLHKSYYDGKNYQSFGYSEICSEIKHLCSTLDVDPIEAKIKLLEFGVNVPLNESPVKFLNKSLLCYKGEMFNEYKKDRKGICLGYYSQLTEYSVKVYDKSLQYDLKHHLMRFELRYTRLRELRKKAGIESLYDLMRPEIYPVLNGLLLAAWDNVLLYESGIKKDNLSKVQKVILSNADNPRYWIHLKECGGRKFDRYRREYRKMIDNDNSSHQEIKGLILLECEKSENVPISHYR